MLFFDQGSAKPTAWEGASGLAVDARVTSSRRCGILPRVCPNASSESQVPVACNAGITLVMVSILFSRRTWSMTLMDQALSRRLGRETNPLQSIGLQNVLQHAFHHGLLQSLWRTRRSHEPGILILSVFTSVPLLLLDSGNFKSPPLVSLRHCLIMPEASSP